MGGSDREYFKVLSLQSPGGTDDHRELKLLSVRPQGTSQMQVKSVAP
jgi:hypothetical protein